MQILAIQNFENKINLKYFWTMKKLMFLMFALVMGFSASAQTLPARHHKKESELKMFRY